jgi:hypothetical protein
VDQLKQLPHQPEALRAAIRAHNRNMRREVRAVMAGVLEPADISKASPELRAAYNAWAEQYNAAVRHNRRVAQAQANRRQVQALLRDACPHCKATHPGEC